MLFIFVYYLSIFLTRLVISLDGLMQLLEFDELPVSLRRIVAEGISVFVFLNLMFNKYNK